MKRILVFSDSHGSTRLMDRVILQIREIDGIIHLGDIDRDIRYLEDTYFEFPIYGVEGNNGTTGQYPSEKTITIEGKKILITHGNCYVTNFNPDPIKRISAVQDVDLILYGHTHLAYREVYDGKILANPGSISRPRRGNPSYGVIEIENGVLRYCNIEIPTLF